MKQNIIFYISIVIITIFVSLITVNVVLRYSLEKEIQQSISPRQLVSSQQKNLDEIPPEQIQTEREQKKDCLRECLDEFIKVRELKMGKSKSDCLKKVDKFSAIELIDFYFQFRFDFDPNFIKENQVGKLVECCRGKLEISSQEYINTFSFVVIKDMFFNHLKCKLFNKNEEATYKEIKSILNEMWLKYDSFVQKSQKSLDESDYYANLKFQERFAQMKIEFAQFNEEIDKLYQSDLNTSVEQNVKQDSEISAVKTECEAKDFFSETKDWFCGAVTQDVRFFFVFRGEEK